MEITYCKIFLRPRKESTRIETQHRGRRLSFLRGRQVGNRLRSAWPVTAAHCGAAESNCSCSRPVRLGLGFSLGHRLSTVRMESGGKQMERDASSFHATES